jgi:diacylglycerol kinase family enzyme
MTRFEALRELPGLYEARHVNHPKVRFYRTRWILIEGEEPTRVHLDGEPWGTLPIRVEALPAAIEVAVAA